MKFCSSWKIESETLIAFGNTTLCLSSTDEVWTKWVVVYIVCVNEFLDKCIPTFESYVNKCNWNKLYSEMFCSNLRSFSRVLYCISTCGVFLCKDSCSENCVLIDFVFISETLLQNFAANNGLCMWSPEIY